MNGLVLQRRPSLKKRVAKAGAIGAVGAALGYKAANSPTVQALGAGVKRATKAGYAAANIKKAGVGLAARSGALEARNLVGTAARKGIQRGAGVLGSAAGAVGFAARKARMSRAGMWLAKKAATAMKLIGEA